MNNYLDLNAQLNLYGEDGEIQVEKDREAARRFFLEHVNVNTRFFHDLEEKWDYMTTNGYWDSRIRDSYSFSEIKDVFKFAYSFKHRFNTFVGAYKFYASYALKSYDGEEYLERYEDRVAMVALSLADGDYAKAIEYTSLIMSGKYQPATPTFLNAGRADSGELVSCFLLRAEDNMESIAHVIKDSLQLSKRGGGVAINLTNLREAGAPIKNVNGVASGVVPVMKLLEDAFSYANQLGARQGAGAAYLHACHPDILSFLDTKRENADEKIRIKSLSLGVVVPDVAFELAREGRDMYLFSPYDVERVYGVPLTDISVTEHYEEMVENPEIRKTKISARKLFQTIAAIQFESGYPYLVFEDTVNEANPVPGRVNMSNLCSEILQVNSASSYAPDGSQSSFTNGTDISCNLGSLNIAKVMEAPEDLAYSVRVAVHMLTAVSDQSYIKCSPSVKRGNSHYGSIGLGQMNLHGFLAQNGIEYGSEEALDFVNVYFAMVRYYALQESCSIARETGHAFFGFWDSDYASRKALLKYEEQDFLPTTAKVRELFKGTRIPTREDWSMLSEDIACYGLYNAYLLAVPPTGNISYVNESTPSIHPVTSPIEIRKEGKMGRVYYPAPGLSKETLPFYKDAYEVGYKKLIDTYAVATQHTDQGLSLTLFFPDTATTRDLNKAQIYAWSKGIKTIYYVRLRQEALEGTGVQECVSCTL